MKYDRVAKKKLPLYVKIPFPAVPHRCSSWPQSTACAAAAVVTVILIGKEKRSGWKSVLCVYQDGLDGFKRRRRSVQRACVRDRMRTSN